MVAHCLAILNPNKKFMMSLSHCLMAAIYSSIRSRIDTSLHLEPMNVSQWQIFLYFCENIVEILSMSCQSQTP